MGIDIGDLSTLALCSVPPEQANYVQRIGRTGRRDGNSLNLTIATGRPHDLYFWAEPKEMIAGAIKTPGVHLKAFAILKRQFAAYTLDRWNHETTLGAGEGYGTLRTCFENLQFAARKLAETPPPKVLEAYLRGSDGPRWDKMPKILSLATLLASSSEKKPEVVRTRLAAAGGGALQDFLEDLGPEASLAMISKGAFSFVAGMPTPPDWAKVQPLILLDDSQGNTPLQKRLGIRPFMF